MKGLLLGELYSTWKYLKLYFLLVVIFVVISGFSTTGAMFMLAYPIFIMGMIPVTLLTYDERSKWDVYAGTMPVSRGAMVSSKYLIGLAGLLFSLLLTAVAQAIRCNHNWNEFVTIMLIIVTGGFFSSALLPPLMFKCGTEKMGIVTVATAIAVYAVTAVVAGVLGDISFASVNVLLWAAALGSIVLYALSWLLSIHFYKNREL